jgi:hypothetical protein
MFFKSVIDLLAAGGQDFGALGTGEGLAETQQLVGACANAQGLRRGAGFVEPVEIACIRFAQLLACTRQACARRAAGNVHVLFTTENIANY